MVSESLEVYTAKFKNYKIVIYIFVSDLCKKIIFWTFFYILLNILYMQYLILSR